MRLARRRPLSRTLGLVALALVVALPGCARSPQAGVNVKPLTTELVFGVPEIEESSAPPNFADPVDPLPIVNLPRTRPPTFNPPPEEVETPRECPEAGLTAFPKKPVTTVIEELPAQETYDWRVKGTQTLDGNPVQLASVSSRTVKNVIELSETVFRFEVEERELLIGSQRVITQTFEVRQNNDGVTEDGVFLRQIKTTVGAETTSFIPDPPVMYLPIPTTLGSPAIAGRVQQPQMNETGVDGRTQAVLRHRGTVLNRFTADACGEPVQGFFVDAHQEFIDPRGQSYTRNYNYLIASQYGGLIIWEKIERPCPATQQTSEEEQQADEKNVDKCDPPGDFRVEARIGELPRSEP